MHAAWARDTVLCCKTWLLRVVSLLNLTLNHQPMCTQIAAARRELVRELLRGRRSDLPLMLKWKGSSSRWHITVASLQLAHTQGALKFMPHDIYGSLVSPELEVSEQDIIPFPLRSMVVGHPCVAIDALELLPRDVRWVDRIQTCAASEALAEVRPTGRFRQCIQICSVTLML